MFRPAQRISQTHVKSKRVHALESKRLMLVFDFAGKLASNRLVVVGVGIIFILVALALAAPLARKAGWLRDPLEQFQKGLDADDMPLAPNATFKLGTDHLG